MAFLPSQMPLLAVLAVAVCSATGLPPFFEGYYQPAAYYYPNMRYSRSAPSGASSYAASSSGASSSSGTHVAPGPGGSGMFNAFAGTGPAGDFGPPPGFGQPAYGYGYGFPGFSFPNFKPFDFNTFYEQYFKEFEAAQRKAQEAAASGNGVYYEGPGYVVWGTQYPGDSGSFFSSFGGTGFGGNDVGVGASASGQYSPGGGYGSASVFPGAPEGMDQNFGAGFEERFGAGTGPVNSVSGSFTPPGGKTFGVFTSSSSKMSNVDGKVTSSKQATVGVNDNGKVTTYTAHDP